jgi:hypothetical protein
MKRHQAKYRGREFKPLTNEQTDRLYQLIQRNNVASDNITFEEKHELLELLTFEFFNMMKMMIVDGPKQRRGDWD